MTADERWQRGAESFTEVTGMPAPNRGDDYVADVVIDQIFAELWTRPGLTREERRWISITCACMTGAPTAMEVHLGSALRTGDISIEELREFVIHFAAYATAARTALDAAWAHVNEVSRQ